MAVNRHYDFSRVRRVAVVSFSGPGGDAAADFLAQNLLAAGVEVVERRQLEQILKEHRLAGSGALNPATLQEVGRILGVDALFTGTVTTYQPPQGYLIFPGSGLGAVAATPVGTGSVYSRGTLFAASQSEVIASAAVVGLSARMVSVENTALLWAAHQVYEGFDVPSAMQSIASSFVRSLLPIWPTLSKQ
ncbi:MAG: hypothetical protein HY402_04120 [Elusimicrobia bacterium]|nr:hypothetical protein [Elusimicrobiota bacterium]